MTTSYSVKSAPNLSERQKCYASRDAYFDCLAKHNPQGDAPSDACDKLKDAYQSNCRPAWVSFVWFAIINFFT